MYIIVSIYKSISNGLGKSSIVISFAKIKAVNEPTHKKKPSKILLKNFLCLQFIIFINIKRQNKLRIDIINVVFIG